MLHSIETMNISKTFKLINYQVINATSSIKKRELLMRLFLYIKKLLMRLELYILGKKVL